MSVILCAVCDKIERECTCDRYCTNCMGQMGVRLCSDGFYHCPECREACDLTLANPEK
jgi:hypothetical protein